MKEAFLINPPKKAPKAHKVKTKKTFHWDGEYSRKHRGAKGTKHRPVVYTDSAGHWTTPLSARVAMGGRRLNPFGESLMLVGANPRRRNKMARRHRRKHNPARRRRNPVAQLTHIIPALIAGGAGIVAVNKGSQMLGMTQGSIMDYGAKLAIVVGGGYVADKYISKQASDGWVIASGATVAWQILSMLLGKVGVALPGVAGFGEDELLAAYPDASMAAFPDYSGYGYDMEPSSYGV